MTGKIDDEAEKPRDGIDGALAACALACVPGIGAAALSRVAQAYGSSSKAVEAGAAALAARSDELGLAPRAREYLERGPNLERLGAWAMSEARAAGARVVTPADATYPALLRKLENPPPVLYLRGELAGEAKRVALVGARAADEPALRLSRELAEDLAAAGVEVVSGGARGVDAAAHAGALRGGGTTVAVLGSGIDVSYPPENAALFERIASGGGALVSEFPPGTPSSRPNFPRRNRTIAGLSHAIVVVRASTTSGALITARHAAKAGRPVFAVPGEPHDALTAGPHRLLAAATASPVSCAADVVRLLGWPVPDRLVARSADPVRTGPPGAAASAAPLDGPALRMLEVLDAGRALHIDVLAARADLRAHEALSWLAELELKGLILQKPGKYFLRRLGSVVNRNGSAGI